MGESKAGKRRVPHRPHARSSTSRSARPSFEERALLENYAALIDEIVRAKPAAAKGRYLRTITLATTMGPGVRVDTTRTRNITWRRRGASLRERDPTPETPGGSA